MTPHCRAGTMLSVLIALFFTSGLVLADQSDERLPQLFSDLGNAPNARAGAAIEQQIWVVWFESSDGKAHAQLKNARGTAERGQVDEAMALFNKLVDDYPTYAEGWNQRAIMRYLVGDIGGSLADIDEVLRLEPRHFGALSGRGQCLIRQERYLEALNAFESALNINPWIQSSARQIQMLRTLINQQQNPI